MKRDIARLEDQEYDLLIIGGGITGACLAFDAVLRGYRVALLEKGDFGGATSSASSKLLHGGIRYLQQGDIAKLRESARERMYFLRLAPHLVRFVPFVIPTFRGLRQGRLLMALAMRIYNLLCSGLNAIVKDPACRVPPSRVLGREELRRILPEFGRQDLTGGIEFHEAHMQSSERMTLAFIDSAARRGAVVANYARVDGFLRERGRVVGVRFTDLASDQAHELRAGLTLNAAGPWIPTLLGSVVEDRARRLITGYSSGAHIVTRPLTERHAIALPTEKQNQAVVNRGGRHIFVIPWRGRSLIGTTYHAYGGDLDQVRATERDISELIDDINTAVGTALLRREDVHQAFAGIYPLVEDEILPQVYQGTGEYSVVDHEASDGIAGLVSVFGAKYTTARLLAEKALDLVDRRLQRPLRSGLTRHTSLYAGRIADVRGFHAGMKHAWKERVSKAQIDRLITAYGIEIGDILPRATGESLQPLGDDCEVLVLEVLHAVRNEMALHLADVVFRRTGMATTGLPEMATLRRCASLMAAELGWNDDRMEREIEAVVRHSVAAPAGGEG